MAQSDPRIYAAAQKIRAKAGAEGLSPPKDVMEWAARYRRIDGTPFSLDRFGPLADIYRDECPRIVVMKPAQRGVSEWAVNLACFALEYGAERWTPEDARKSGLNVAYIFPVQQALNDFSKERISGLRNETIHLSQMFSDDSFDALGFKQVGQSYFYLRGGWSESALLSFAADILILDEFDRMAPQAIALARRRMNASIVRREVAISTPTLPGRGIHAAYLSSDRRVYRTRCPACGEQSTFDFFRDVRVDGLPYETWRLWSPGRMDLATVTLHCPACSTAVDDAARCAPGEWVPEQPEVTTVHGYHIPWWPFRFVDLQAMCRSALSDDPTEIQELYRSDLGLPYTAAGSIVTEDMLRQLSAELPGGMLPLGPLWRDTVLGADIGARHHYRVTSLGPDGRVYVRSMGSVQDWAGLDMLMQMYRVRLAVVDAEPELHAAIEFCNRWKGRALRAFYPSQATALRGVLYHRKKDTADVQVNRTLALDRVYAAVAGGGELWPADIANEPETLAHMTSPTRVTTTDAHGQERHDWVHTRPDHLFHACAYSIVARECLPKSQPFAPAVGGSRPLLTAYRTMVTRPEYAPLSRHGRLPDLSGDRYR